MRKAFFVFNFLAFIFLFSGCEAFENGRLNWIEETVFHTSSLTPPEFDNERDFIVNAGTYILPNDEDPIEILIPIKGKGNPYSRTVLYRAKVDSEGEIPDSAFERVADALSPYSVRTDFISDAKSKRDETYVYKITSSMLSSNSNGTPLEGLRSERSRSVKVKSGRVEGILVTVTNNGSSSYYNKRVNVTWEPVEGADYYIIYKYYGSGLRRNETSFESTEDGSGYYYVCAHFPEYGGYEGVCSEIQY